MVNPPDVIGLGALNVDYVFDYRTNDEPLLVRAPEVGAETLCMPDEDVEDAIRVSSHRRRRRVSVSLGGSAFLAIRTLASMELPGLDVAFVGVLGRRMDLEDTMTLDQPIDEALRGIGRDWIFEEPTLPPGRSHVRLQRGRRFDIGVAEGANRTLRARILQKERDEYDGARGFTGFLASARWLHLTSLCSHPDFRFLLARIAEARDRNRQLRVSLDPGYEYTKKENHHLLAEACSVSDYLFLNGAEYSSLADGADASPDRKGDALKALFKESKNPNPQVVVWKQPSRIQLIPFWNKNPLPQRTYCIFRANPATHSNRRRPPFPS